jgi:hypothetical protein
METKTEIYEYEIELTKCPICNSNTYIKAFSAKSEKKVVTILIQFMKTHLKNCESYHGQKVELNVKLNQKTRSFAPRIMTYETKKVGRKIIV